MSLIKLVEYHCKSCLKCVRNCPTKAIQFKKNHPYIIEEECIHCGNCYLCCPQSAKEIRSDLGRIQQWLNDESQEVVVSVAPSFQAVWPSFSALKKQLLQLGFNAVEETAKGAQVVSAQYGYLLQEKKMENIIETCCPVIVRLIETQYPDLIPYLSPVASPMIVHGKMLKEKYPNAKVVFLSPCIAKQDEILDLRNEGVVDAVLAMPDLDAWLSGEFDESTEEMEEENIARIYPVSGGIIKTLSDCNGYKTLAVEGIRRCKTLLDSIQNGQMKGYFFEMNACEGGCLGGPYLLAYRQNEWPAQSRLAKYEDSKKIEPHFDSRFINSYFDQSVKHPPYSEEQIQSALNSMGKNDRSKCLDCGACGYETCREKAIAILEGKSDPKHCLPYALENAESMSNLVIRYSPNGIIVVNASRRIQEINASALKLLGLQNFSVKGFELEAVLPSLQLKQLLEEQSQDVQYFIEEFRDGEVVCECALLPLLEEQSFVIILMDLTSKMKQEERMNQIRKDTIESTQKVIDKQMRVVQEIASLLGETTAETKVVLTKLNKAMGDIHE